MHESNTGRVAIGYADIIAVYDSTPAESPAWDVADEWLRYLALRASGQRLLLATVNANRNINR